MNERQTAEGVRLEEDARREKNWKRWGPYLSERQWATVREDYSGDGDNWRSFPYEHSLSRAYRWGEDGLLGLTDRECRLCLSLALWNGNDPHLKERLFGLTNPQGNHGEDVKEIYFYQDALPTFCYFKSLYRYPHAAYPYAQLAEESRRRNRRDPEHEVTDTTVFDGNRYFDVTMEVAKASPDDILVRYSAVNRGPESAKLWLVPTLWFRNTWSWGVSYEEGEWPRPSLQLDPSVTRRSVRVVADHATLGRTVLSADGDPDWLFTENVSNAPKLFGSAGEGDYYKDAFHDYVVHGKRDAVKRDGGTKAAAVYSFDVPAGGEVTVRLRLTAIGRAAGAPFVPEYDRTFERRKAEADEYYTAVIPQKLSDNEKSIVRQAYAGLLFNEQFYHYVIPDWVAGDKKLPLPQSVRDTRINRDWRHLFSRDVLSVPDKWEYPAFFSWDTAFHMVPMASIDPKFAKDQLILLLREWYLHPNGQLPAYEYDLSNVTPPVHAWACWEVFQITGGDDYAFLSRAFHKLMMNFTWWVNRKDPDGRGVFGGGFLGLDNIGVFDRSKPLPVGGQLQQADGTAWMGFYCATMLQISLALALNDHAYDDVASKFFEHFVAVAEAINHLDGAGLWDERDGFYYDRLKRDGRPSEPLRARSLVGFIPLLAVTVMEEEVIKPNLPDFEKRMLWFFKYRGDSFQQTAELEEKGQAPRRSRLLTLVGRDRLKRLLAYMLDENEFLSPFGVRSMSRAHKDKPYVFRPGDGQEFRVGYQPADMESADFGGNSNWRGPVWFPINFLLIEALHQYHNFFGDDFQVECPTGSGQMKNLDEVAREIAERMARLFKPDASGARPCHGPDRRWADDPNWRDLLLFHEYFDGDTGRGLGASHQTGWTALIATMLDQCARRRG